MTCNLRLYMGLHHPVCFAVYMWCSCVSFACVVYVLIAACVWLTWRMCHSATHTTSLCRVHTHLTNRDVTFHKRATKFRLLLRKMTYKDKGSYGSSPDVPYIPHYYRVAKTHQMPYLYTSFSEQNSIIRGSLNRWHTHLTNRDVVYIHLW